MTCQEKKSRSYSALIVLLPLLNQYMFFSLTFMDLFNVGAIIWVLVKERGRLKVGVGFIPYIIYAILLMLWSMLNLSVYSPLLMAKNVASFVVLAINMFFFAKQYFDLEYAFHLYGKITMINCAICVIEYLVNLVTSFRMVLVFPGLTLNYGGGMSGLELINLLKHSYINYRASGLFLEPSYFAEYCLPFLYLLMFYSSHRLERKTIIGAIFITLSLALTTSMLGILGCVIAWSLYIGKLLWSSKRQYLIILIPIIVGIGFYLYNLDAIQTQIVSKTYSIQNLTMSTSLSLRLMRGWYCFQELSPMHKMLGVGYGCISSFFTENNITTVIDKEGIVNSYMNGISLMLCSLGVVGTALYLIPFSKIIKKGNVLMLAVLWLTLMITSQMFDNASYFLLVVFLLTLADKDKEYYI